MERLRLIQNEVIQLLMKVAPVFAIILLLDCFYNGSVGEDHFLGNEHCVVRSMNDTNNGIDITLMYVYVFFLFYWG
jgi:hypothetical protein